MLPLKPREKTPLGRLVHNGNKDASTETKTIERWWGEEPDANIGLLTGTAFDVLDIDGPEAVTALNALAPGYQHRGPVSSTGKGYHLLFAVTGSRNHAKMASAPIDFRGEGGYIVAAPSIHPLGHRYEWQFGRPNDLPTAPDWLTTLLFPPKPERKANTNPDIEAFLDQNDIVAMFGGLGLNLERAGQNFRTECIFHDDSTPSLVIYPRTNSFYCFGCGAWGDPLNLKRWQTDGRLR